MCEELQGGSGVVCSVVYKYTHVVYLYTHSHGSSTFLDYLTFHATCDKCCSSAGRVKYVIVIVHTLPVSESHLSV